MVSATASNVIQGQSLKLHFVPIGALALSIQSFIFSKKNASSLQLQIHPTDLIQAKILLI
jgi:hypothetical protein